MFHKNLRKFRTENHLTQSSMAEMMNITASQYSKIETGKNDLSIHHVKALAAGMGKDFMEIYAMLDEKINDERPNTNTAEKSIPDSTAMHPELKQHFETSLALLLDMCVKKDMLITVHRNGNITLERKQQLRQQA